MKSKKLAEAAAEEFVSEFGEPLNSSKTDWDAVAWDNDARKLPFRHVLRANNDLAAEAWEVYRRTLVAETKARTGGLGLLTI